jgi:amidase
MPFNAYYNRPMPREDLPLHQVGPGTPGGEYLRRFWHPILLQTTAVMPFELALDYPPIVKGRAMRNYVEWLAPTFPATLAGVPALAVPCGLSADGLPIGLQIIGRPHHEEQLFAVGAAIEQVHPFVFPPLHNEIVEAHHGH